MQEAEAALLAIGKLWINEGQIVNAYGLMHVYSLGQECHFTGMTRQITGSPTKRRQWISSGIATYAVAIPVQKIPAESEVG
jgi:hypothetical protein